MNNEKISEKTLKEKLENIIENVKESDKLLDYITDYVEKNDIPNSVFMNSLGILLITGQKLTINNKEEFIKKISMHWDVISMFLDKKLEEYFKENFQNT